MFILLLVCVDSSLTIFSGYHLSPHWIRSSVREGHVPNFLSSILDKIVHMSGLVKWSIILTLKVSNRQLAQSAGDFWASQNWGNLRVWTSAKHYCCTCECNSFFLVQGPWFLPPHPSSFIPQTFIEHLLCSSWDTQVNKTDMVRICPGSIWWELRSSSFIYMFNKHSCSAWYLIVSVLGIGPTGLKKRDMAHASVQFIIWVGRDVKQRSS